MTTSSYECFHVDNYGHIDSPCDRILATKGDAPASRRNISAYWYRRSMSASSSSFRSPV
ncbi:MAG: hypothetical protein GDA56_00260 [Hormoscilla sp. GM7CHS1pb]|nr:hypothetical protein [Hormoscilla sp. GM7CHS1pb]